MEESSIYRKDFLCHFGDSSNYTHDGANGHEGPPERLQRLAKEQRLKDLAKYNAKQIADRLLKGEL